MIDMSDWGKLTVKQEETVKEIEKQETILPSSTKSRGLVVLLYGDTSTGKTHTTMSFPEPIVIIDTESRAINTKNALFKTKNIKIHEPTEIKDEVTRSMDDMLDEVKSINNLTEALSSYISDVKSGKIKGGTLVVDSVTDVWSWCSDWGYDKLQYMKTSKGEQMSEPDMQKIVDQRMWKVATHKHQTIILVLRTLVKYGVNVVFTAREKSVPEYATNKPQGKEKIRCQKDVPFAADIIINLRRDNGKYLAYIEKLGVRKSPTKPIEEITYEKIIELKPMG